MTERSGNVRLTPHERITLDLVVEGYSNKEIAQAMKISDSTAKFYVQKLLERFGVRSRLDLTVLGIRTGVVNRNEISSGNLRSSLASHERKVLDFIARGYSAEKIARELNISAGTAERYVQILRERFGTSSRSEIAAAVSLSGFVDRNKISSRKPISSLLNPTEIRILNEAVRLGGTGESTGNDQIARELRLSPATVKGYIEQIIGKFGARNRAHAVALYLKDKS